MDLLKAVSVSKSVELINVFLYASYKGVLVREDYVVCYFIICIHMRFIILLIEYCAFSCFIGEPAEIHQCRVSSPSCEQE